MATAVAKTTIPKPVTTVTLTLDHEEARTLSAILARVGGCSHTSHRKYAAAIWRALHDIDYHVYAEDMDERVGGNIYFSDGSLNV